MIRGPVWLLLLAFSFAGCSRPSRVAAGARDQVLLIGNGAEPKDLDPQTGQTTTEYTISTALFEGLVNLANDGRTLLPGVAERWEVSADGRVYTFHLRNNACWSDGTALTAEDFLYSFRRVFDPALACENALYGFAIAGARDYASGKTSSAAALGLRAIEPRTFEVRLDYRAPYFLTILAGAPFVPVPRAVLERFGGGRRQGTAWTRPGNLIGNGAFILKAWRPSQDLLVARNPRYWASARVRLRQIRFFPTDDAPAEERAFRSGQLHATFSLPLDRVAIYRRGPDRELHITAQLNTVYLIFRTSRPPFDDVRVRRAFSLAIDRDRLIPSLLQESATPAHSLTRPGTDGYAPPAVIDHDPNQARRLLAAAGYPNGAGFPRVEFAFPNGLPRVLMEALQQVWRRELGIRVELVSQEKKAIFDRLGAENFQLAIMGFFYAINAPETILLVPLSDSQFNFAQWRRPAYDRAYFQATHFRTDGERRAGLDAMERLLQAEAPYVPLYYVNQCFLVSPMVKGWRDNPLGQIDWRELYLQP